MKILSNMLWVPKDSCDTEKLRKELTVIPKYDNLNPIETFIESQDYFGIPRNYFPIPEDVVDKRIRGVPRPIEFKGTLRPVQEEVVNSWQGLYQQGKTDYIVSCETGSGKTVIALKIASELKVPFLVVVPRDRLMQQWKDEIQKFTDIWDIGHIQQNTCDYEGKTACVGMVHSLSKDKYPEEMKNYFGLIIYDELQVLGAETFSEVAKMFPAKYKMGLSATPERSDGMENAYFFHLGKDIISTEQKTQPPPKIFLHEYSGYSGKLPFWLDRNDVVKVRACILSNLADNKERNEIIAKATDQLIKSGRQTLVIGDRIKQLEEIEGILKRKYGHEDIGLYISKTSAKKKYWLEKEGKAILATTKMLDIGIDIDTLRGLVFATPKSEVHQIVGRIRRINPNVKEPVVVDIIDTCYPECDRWKFKRLKYYNNEGFEINYLCREN